MERKRWLGLPRRWAIGLAIFVVAALVGAVLILQWMQRGLRRLDVELEALRASGAPEFLEQIVLPQRGPGEDPKSLLVAINDPYVEWKVEDLAACAQLLAAGESDHEIESDLYRALADPRRATALSECQFAVLRRRLEADAEALELALRIESASRFDWSGLWRAPHEPIDYLDLDASFERAFGHLLALPPIPGYIRSIDLLCADAVRSALEGDEEGALHRLSLAGKAVALFEHAPVRIPFQSWVTGHQWWIRSGILPLLHLLPAETNWSEIDALLAATDVEAQMLRALEGERAIGNTMYRIAREAGSWKPSRATWAPDWLSQVWLRNDQAMYLELFRPVLSSAREHPPIRVWEELRDEAADLAEEKSSFIHGSLWGMLAYGLPECGLVSTNHELYIHLCRAAILARTQDAESALAFLATERDPYDEAPLRSRLDPDGILVMWSVGPDRKDDLESSSAEPGDDLRVAVRVK